MFFLAQTLRYPKFTGTVAPNSKELAGLVTKKGKLKSASVIVEVGPGTGFFTREILRKKKSNAKYLGIETNGAFVDCLKKEIPGVTVTNDSAENISDILKREGINKCDRIISGLPWTAFERDLQDKLIKKFLDVLGDEGLFITFSYQPFNNLPKGKVFREKLESNFSKVDISEVVCNIQSVFVYVCKK